MDEVLKGARAPASLDRVALALPYPILLIGAQGQINDANPAAESFFDMGLTFLRRTTVERLCGPSSALAGIVTQCRNEGTSFNIYRIDLGTPRLGTERLVDINASPMPDEPARSSFCCKNGQLPINSAGS